MHCSKKSDLVALGGCLKFERVLVHQVERQEITKPQVHGEREKAAGIEEFLCGLLFEVALDRGVLF